ncbi:uncharacterized protein PFL1_00989 [Pseudozyma flocculosa PF-1]|uniref:Related to soluble epoxide hydrolase n=1 Tax=Pseudozyma flocculosa TaxID=84751 RepID=A0A5C3FBB9_9BASI|nr:uncharacterized protein PFL1_00989 [Pseudozyma flocculosa PF-1]EPQ31656.1 hypothetical protein PFL1_00989 [Pseudozyma flocculosa PF-1]SPO40771.1 related to soluble epoxide hydrolase [Pseudozyma flocculosa]
MAQPGISQFYVTPLAPSPSQPDGPATQRRYHYLDYHPPQGVPQRATILLLHGFPDFSRGWRNVVAPLQFSGYRLIVPDLLGYGLTSAPRSSPDASGQSRIAEYSGRSICADLDGLLDHAKAGQGAEFGSHSCDSQGRNGRVIVVSHDWGGWLGWKTAQWIPHRIMGVASLCVPYQPPTSKPISMDQLIQGLPNFGYQKFFADPRSTKIIEDNLERFFRIVYMIPGLFSGDGNIGSQAADWYREGQLEKLLTSPEFQKVDLSSIGKSLLDEAELQRYVSTFKSRGMEGPLTWYRTRPINYKDDQTFREKGLPATLPALLLQPTDDVAVPPSMGKGMPKHVPAVRLVEINGSGHFAQNELPNVVVAEIKKWIDEAIIPSEKNGTWFQWIKSRL